MKRRDLFLINLLLELHHICNWKRLIFCNLVLTKKEKILHSLTGEPHESHIDTYCEIYIYLDSSEMKLVQTTSFKMFVNFQNNVVQN